MKKEKIVKAKKKEEVITEPESEEKGGKETIKDPILHPYYLIVDSNNFALHKEINSKFQMQAIGYYTSLERALKKIAHLQTVKKLSEKKQVTLKEHIEMFAKILKAFTDKFIPFDVR